MLAVEKAGKADGQWSRSNGWQRAEKVRWVYIPKQGCSTEEVYQSSQKMAACAVLDKKVCREH